MWVNKYQFALKEIRKMLSFAGAFNVDNELHDIQELVDKETPMKPSILWIDDQGFIQANCKICDSHMYYKQERCSSASCGRVADWTDEDE